MLRVVEISLNEVNSFVTVSYNRRFIGWERVGTGSRVGPEAELLHKKQTPASSRSRERAVQIQAAAL